MTTDGSVEEVREEHRKAEQKDKCPECKGRGSKPELVPFTSIPIDGGKSYPCPICHGTGEKKLSCPLRDASEVTGIVPVGILQDCSPDMVKIAKSNAVGMGLIPPDRPDRGIADIIVDYHLEADRALEGKAEHYPSIVEAENEIIALIEPLIEDAIQKERRSILDYERKSIPAIREEAKTQGYKQALKDVEQTLKEEK